MRIRGYDKAKQEIKLEMTPMIDIVFQLLVFFIMTYKVTAMEGDYGIRMPLAADEQTIPDTPLEDVLILKLNSNQDRYLESIEVQFGLQEKRYSRDPDNPQSMFESLRAFVIGAMAGGNGGPETATEIEAEIECQYDLRYEETVRVVEAISGYKTDDGQIHKLIEKIKFRDSG